ncbi:MAG: alkaline phosphatase family protein [Planctomycetia bacterium]|nr:alkaline phosphatase family protein [Planctomycetia bacterium]
MRKKVVVIGIDGMDSLLVERFIEEMPNFKQIRANSPKLKFTSIFPPDSTPAWASIYTGLNPARHGIINFVNPADKEGKVVRKEAEDNDFKGRTFWDIAGNFGKKSCIVLPFNIYPGWEITGSMICRVNTVASKGHPLSTFPDSLLKKYSPSSTDLNMLQQYFSLKQLPKLADMCRKRTYAEGELAVKMLKGEDWDIFFIYFSALDGIQHFFWNYFDEAHPNHPNDNPYKNIIKEFYLLIDEMVGKIITCLDVDMPVIILSDHGHGTRPTKLLNINQVLLNNGYLTPSHTTSKRTNPLHNTKLIKKLLISYVNKFGVGNFGLKMAQKFPLWKKVLASPLAINWDKTKAYVTDLSAVKSYSYGGIRINRDVVSKEHQDDIVDNIIKILLGIEDTETTKKIVKYARRREELYQGNYIEKYPEIVLELEDSYGLGWEINGSLFDYGFTHSIQPGSHKKDTPILYTLNLNVNTSREISLMDFAPTILKQLNISFDFEKFDGRSFIN